MSARSLWSRRQGQHEFRNRTRSVRPIAPTHVAVVLGRDLAEAMRILKEQVVPEIFEEELEDTERGGALPPVTLGVAEAGVDHDQEAGASTAGSFAPLITSHSISASSPKRAGNVILPTMFSYCGNRRPVKLMAR